MIKSGKIKKYNRQKKADNFQVMVTKNQKNEAETKQYVRCNDMRFIKIII